MARKSVLQEQRKKIACGLYRLDAALQETDKERKGERVVTGRSVAKRRGAVGGSLEDSLRGSVSGQDGGNVRRGIGGDMSVGAFELACGRSDEFREGGLMDLPKCLVVIPARGGSKRIRNKNIVKFMGKPLLGYSLEVARDAGIFDHIHVSTDSEEVAGVAERFGYAPEFMRDGSIADDVTGVWAVMKWVVERFRERGEEYDCVCLLSACMPLLELDDLRGGLNYYIELGGRHIVMACCEYLSNPRRALSLGENGEIAPYDKGSFYHARSQELGDYVMDTGAFAFRSVSGLMGEREGGEEEEREGMRAFILEREKGVDINTERDLEFAKVLYRGKFGKG